ncbi:LacI family DNA-binding transcriptional regulator [Curvibacter sp. CHRR-16]|uniref:LacI family DNA-binding transcriptional regulator n=1 Tax=Curvibacter sp. CHRR-16 TaxID=2835872 RepID=UPI001BDAEFD3|nr:LacI family DNA-binding transcriptional regulator [Curvibacter sp. CHRR-16]MBT0569902.1 LacI family DNA-binding transcriptional regulator [Curvibacter sp. CHRR-16]
MVRKSTGVNIKQLAQSLGLSISTVSRALNGYPDVNQQTRERVQEMANSMGYAPDARAQRLVRGRADAVGMVYSATLGYMGNPQFLATADGIAQRLQMYGQDFLLAVARTETELNVYRRLLHGGRVDGVIVANTRQHDERIDWLLASGYPFVAYGRTTESHGYAWLDLDNVQAGRLAAEHLAKLGHKHFAYVHVDMGMNFAFQRREGFLQVLRAAGLNCPPQNQVDYANDVQSGMQAAQQLLQLTPLPTAVVVDTNLGVQGVIEGLQAAGVQVGRDVSVLVHGIQPQLQLSDGRTVTTVAQPPGEEIGRLLADIVWTVLRGAGKNDPHYTHPQVLCQPVLLPGDTTGPVAA